MFYDGLDNNDVEDKVYCGPPYEDNEAHGCEGKLDLPDPSAGCQDETDDYGSNGDT